MAVDICLLFLTIFGILDLEEGKVSNYLILLFLLIGIVLASSLLSLLVCFAMLCFGYFLWKSKVIGGADAKILSCIPLYFQFVDITTFLLEAVLFLVIFAIVGTIYSLVLTLLSQKRKIPFVPAIAFSYGIFAILRLLI